MHIKKLLLPFLLVLSLLALFRRTVARSAPVKPLPGQSSYAAIDAYLAGEMHRLKMPGAFLAVVEGNQITHRRGFGRSHPGGAAPTPQTPFFIGSLTKSVTAMAVVQLVEAGKVDLDTPVQHYLPWFRVADPQASSQITVRHLLNQTSSLPESCGEVGLADFSNGADATERQARALASVDLKYPVGSICEYCNMNYNLLGLIIEAASGKAYADYVHEHIFTPLNMSHSYSSPVEARQNGLAMGHRYWFGVPFPAPNLPTPHGSLPSGQLISTGEDMAHYLIAQLNDGRFEDIQILSPVGLDELHHGVREYRKMGVSAGKYAMGWFVGTIGQTKILWHSGTNADFGAYMAILPEQKKGLVLLFNADHHWFNPIVAQVGARAVTLLAGEPPLRMLFALMLPWMLHGQLLIPALQIAGMANTLRLLRRWRLNPGERPSGQRMWGLHILLPLILNLTIAATLKPMLGKRRDYLMLFMPDYAWLAIICGSLALAWSSLRTVLVLRAVTNSPQP